MLTFRMALSEDGPEIAGLINSAYRGEVSRSGWTTEADLVRGLRITAPEVHELLNKQDSWIFMAVEEEKILACVHLRRDSPEVFFFGMLAVSPQLQAKGIGKKLIKTIEDFSRAHKGRHLFLSVIQVRSELISYYERAGFRKTGRLLPFPYPELVIGPEIELMEMAKEL